MTDKPKQIPLFDLDVLPIVEQAPNPSRWYYVTRRRNQEMLHYIAADGTPVWTEHDTRTAQPMLFNSSHTAHISARLHGGTEVKRWYWTQQARDKANGA